MHRTEGAGFAPGNFFTEGNPSGGIPATTVTDDIMNAFQEEIITSIEAEGITLIKGTNTQLQEAIQLMIASGGGAGTGIQQAIVNNQAAPLDITGLLFLLTTVKAGIFYFDIERQTDSSNELETGIGHVSFDPVANNWRISTSTVFDDAGLTFSITSGGQVQYTSDDLTGTSYSGTIRITNIQNIKQTL